MDLLRFNAYLPLLGHLGVGALFVLFLVGPRGVVRALRNKEKRASATIERYHIRFFLPLILSVLFLVLILPLVPVSVAIADFRSLNDTTLATRGLVLLLFFSGLIFFALTYVTRKGDILWSAESITQREINKSQHRLKGREV